MLVVTRRAPWQRKPLYGAEVDWSHPFAPFLRGFWLLDEGGGTTIRNLAHPANNGTFAGSGTTWVNDTEGNGLSFNGGGNVNVGRGEWLDDLQAETIETLVYLTSPLPNLTQRLVAKQDNGALYNSLMVAANGSFELLRTRASGNFYLGTQPFVTAGNWWHLITTFDVNTNTANLYVNGQEVGTFSQYQLGSGALASDASNDFLLGNRPDLSRGFKGTMLYTRIFGTYCTPEMARDLYTSPYAMLAPRAPVSYFTWPVESEASNVEITGVPCGVIYRAAPATISAPNPPIAVTGVPCGVIYRAAPATISAPNPPIAVTGVPCGVIYRAAPATISAPNPPISVTGRPAGVLYRAAPATVSAPNPNVIINGKPTGILYRAAPAIISAPNPPNTPTLLTAIGGANQIELTWSAPVGGSPPTSYAVRWGTTSGIYPSIIYAGTGTSYTLENRDTNTTYYLVVVAQNEWGESAYSNELSATTDPITGKPTGILYRAAPATVSAPNPPIAVTGKPTGILYRAAPAIISAPNPPTVVTGRPAGILYRAVPATISAPNQNIVVTGRPAGILYRTAPATVVTTRVMPNLGLPASIGYFGLSGARVGNVPPPTSVTGVPARIIFGGAAPTISAPNPPTVVTGRPVGIRYGGAAPTLTQIGRDVAITGVPTGVRFGTVPATVVAPNPEKVITWSPPISMRGTFAFAFQELKQDFTMQLPAPAGVRFGTLPATVVAQKTGFFTFKYNNFGLNVGDEGAVIYTEGGMRTEWLKTLVHPQADSGKIYRSYLDKGKTVYEYYLQRDLDGSGTNTWEAGSSFVNTGKVGDGFIIQYANYGITRTGQAETARTGPTMAGNVRVGLQPHEMEERWVIGNLKGYYDYGATTFGFAAGDRTGPWISVDATNGIRMMRNAEIKAHIRANGTWRFNGDGSQYIDWNGTTLTVAGNINVISGSVPWTTLNGVPGPGVNLLQNPLFDSSTKGWTFNNYNGTLPAATSFANGANLAGWCLPGINTVWASITGGAGSGNLVDLGSNITDVRVTAGDMIEWSVYTGAHRCTVYAYVYFYNADQVNIGFSGFPSTAINAAENAGGTVLSGYKRLWGIVQAPAGSVYARLMLRVMAPNAGQADSYGFFTMPYLGRCTTGQTQPSPWSNSGTRGLFTAPVGDGLHLGPTHMGFYSSGQWRTYMDDQGNFVYRGAPVANSPVITWNTGSGRLIGGYYGSTNYGGFVEQWYTDATTGEIVAGQGRVKINRNGIFGTDGTKPAFTLISGNTTLNGEPMTVGDTLLGDNTAGKANVFFDQSAGRLALRNGTTNVLSFASNNLVEGVLNFGTSGGIYQGRDGTFASPGTGIKIWRGDGTGGTVNGDGLIGVFNGGGYTMSITPSNAITIVGGTSYVSSRAVTFIDSIGTRIGELYGYTDGSTISTVSVRAHSASSSKRATAYVQAANTGATGEASVLLYCSKFTDPTTAQKPWATFEIRSNANTNNAYFNIGAESTTETIGIYGTVTGTVSSIQLTADTLFFTGSKSGFHIDHPLHPLTKTLSHTPLDTDDLKTFYDGSVVCDEDGTARVEMPDWFTALNKDVRYKLTCVGGWSPVFVEEERTGGTITGRHAFSIKGGYEGLRVDWQVTATRHDPFARYQPFQVEREKDEEQRGTLLKGKARNRPEMTYKHPVSQQHAGQ